MKEVLVIHYSQSGQLSDIVHNVVQPLQEESTIKLTFHTIKPTTPFEFPWDKTKFFDAFPETYHQVPIDLEPIPKAILNKKYDLIIFAYQVWFLTPSKPANSFLKSAEGRKLLANTPVITLIGCRNLWIMAQEKTKKLLAATNAPLVGNIVLTDRTINHISVITISHWMFSGRKDRYLGFFPKPGVSDKDIAEATKFGIPIKAALLKHDYSNLQDHLLQKEAVRIKPFLALVDQRANFLFSKWAALITKKGGAGDPKRLKWIKLFNYYLLFAIWFISPIVFIVFLLTYIFNIKKIQTEKRYYSSVRMQQ